MTPQFWLEILHILGTAAVGLIAYLWKKRQENLEKLIVDAVKSQLSGYLPRHEFEASERDRRRMHEENKEEFGKIHAQYERIERELGEQKSAIELLPKRPAKR